MTARLYVALTPAQRDAVEEALNHLTAGRRSDQRLETYDAASAALCNGVVAEVAVFMTVAQLRALLSLADYAHVACEGEPDMTRIYRTPPAERAYRACRLALRKATL